MGALAGRAPWESCSLIQASVSWIVKHGLESLPAFLWGTFHQGSGPGCTPRRKDNENSPGNRGLGLNPSRVRQARLTGGPEKGKMLGRA